MKELKSNYQILNHSTDYITTGKSRHREDMGAFQRKKEVQVVSWIQQLELKLLVLGENAAFTGNL